MELVGAITQWWHGRRVTDTASAARVHDPESQITVTSGCTEAIAATLLGLVEPGDEVVFFEPHYDSYVACCALCGATPRFVALRASQRGRFEFDEKELRAAIGPKTRAILVNTPHNPTGKVFSREELQAIANVCIEKNIIAITDEVYEELTYDPTRPHVSLATLPGMAERTVTLSSLGKSFALTGWKIGWAIATPELSRAVRAAHQFLTFATATPLQHGAAAVAIREGQACIDEVVALYRSNREYMLNDLREIGFGVYAPAGSYFIMADHSAFGLGDDRAFARHLVERVGVAAIPPSPFYEHPEPARRLVRFAFCKKRATLEAAATKLRQLRK
jgi:aspartate/methionine/tyrosine aminotransferase